MFEDNHFGLIHQNTKEKSEKYNANQSGMASPNQAQQNKFKVLYEFKAEVYFGAKQNRKRINS